MRSRFGSLLASAFLCFCLSNSAQVNAATPNIDTATGADLERNIDDGNHLYTNYVNKVKIPQIAITDPALAKALMAYFNDVLPGKYHTTRGEVDFDVMMSKLEDKVKNEHTSMADYSAIKLADLSFEHSLKHLKTQVLDNSAGSATK